SSWITENGPAARDPRMLSTFEGERLFQAGNPAPVGAGTGKLVTRSFWVQVERDVDAFEQTRTGLSLEERRQLVVVLGDLAKPGSEQASLWTLPLECEDFLAQSAQLRTADRLFVLERLGQAVGDAQGS